jgi:hypothetical protein
MADFPFKLGRRPTPPEIKAVMPQLREFIELKPAPQIFDVSGLGGTYPMGLNDQLGDCLDAAQAHMEQVFSAQVDGKPFVATDQDVLKAYEGLGYVPGDPSTDNGGTIPQALEVWRKQGIGGRTIKGWAEVSVSDHAELLSACAEFSGLYAGLNVPQSALDQFNAGQGWDVVAQDGGIAGGHCVPILGYDAAGVILVTWGRVIRATWPFFTAYFDELAVVIPSDYDRLGHHTIGGESEQQLEQELDSIGGNVPVGPPGPAPSPGPPRPPAPGPPAPKPDPWWEWLEDLEQWLEEKFVEGLRD